MKQALYCDRIWFLPLLLSTLLHVPIAQAQEKDPPELVALPKLVGYKLPKDQYLILNCRVDSAHGEFIKNLRRIPSVKNDDVATSLLIDKYLHRKSDAVQSALCYLESDWIARQDLAMLTAVAEHTASMAKHLFENATTQPLKTILLGKKEDFLSMIEVWSNEDSIKKQAKHSRSVFVGDYRCSYRDDVADAMSLVIADAISCIVPTSLWHQEPLFEGFHAYLTSLVALRYETFVSLDATTPNGRRGATVTVLYETAREYLSRSKRERLEQILACELNTLNLERLSVVFALTHYLLERRLEQWKPFCSILEAESLENGKLKGPEGRRAALAKAIQEGFGVSIEELDKQLRDFTANEYLYPEEIAALVGLDRETPDSIFQGFAQVCEFKRAKKPVTAKGEKIYDEMMKKIDKVIQERGEKW